MEYNDQVRELLESYHEKTESEVMPSLAKEFLNFYSGVAELYGKLKNKGLIKDDPYFEASEIIEITTLDNSIFPLADTQWKVAERITFFEATLSFICHNYNFSLNTFNFDELEKIKKILDYYDWKGLLNPTTTDQNTNTLGKVAISFRNSTTDSLVLSTFDNCMEIIIKSVDSIMNKLKFVLLYLKESYKQFIRIDIIPIILEKYPTSGESKMVGLISSEIKNNYSYLKLYKKYITEVVKEEFYEEGADLKERIIQRLTITKKKEIKEIVQDNNTEKDLILILLELGKIRIHFSVAIEKLNQNHQLLVGKEGNLISSFFKKISKILFNLTPKTIYELNIKSKNGKNKPLIINYENFFNEIKKIEFDLLSFTEQDKVINYIKINSKNINHNIDRFLMNIKKDTSIFIGLDEYFKIQLKSKKIKAKGIKPELTVIKSLISSTANLYREYLDIVDK